MAAAPQDAPRHAGQVVRRVLLRRNIAIDAETALLVAAAVQAALSRPGRGALGCPPAGQVIEGIGVQPLQGPPEG